MRVEEKGCEGGKEEREGGREILIEKRVNYIAGHQKKTNQDSGVEVELEENSVNYFPM